MKRDGNIKNKEFASPGKRGKKGLVNKAKGFFSRLFYIIGIVYKASPFMLVCMCLLCLIEGVLPIAGAYISKDLLNAIANLISDGIAEDVFATIRPVLFIVVLQLIYMFLSKVFARISIMVTAITGELVVNYIKLMIMRKAKTVDMCSFDDTSFYEKLENANREAGMRPIGILTATLNVISAMISVCSFIVILATLSPIAPIVIIIASVPGAMVNYYFRNRNFRYIRRHSKERREMYYYSSLLTDKDRAKEIKLMGLADTFEDKYNKAFKKYYKGLKRLFTKEGVYQAIVSLVYVLASSALLLFVIYNVVTKGAQIGDYSLYSGALTSITAYVGTLVASTATIYEGTLFIENMMDFMAEETKVVPISKNPLTVKEGVTHTIELKDVSFRYPGTEKNVINHVNLTLKTDESVVFVGLNGAGKSTLIKLITRLYDPTEGVVLLDGVDIREYDTKSLYNIYGIIFQDFGKYADTVSENIRFGDVDSEKEFYDLETAAKNSNSEQFIKALPKEYQTPLTRLFSDEGIELSGGQWQKLSIARAFYKDSDVLIMDEPTASLDPLAEQDIFTRFTTLSAGKISIFVSHRLSGAVTAGKIVVLEDGEIVEEGTHEELMAKGGKYNLLFSTQAKRYIAGT